MYLAPQAKTVLTELIGTADLDADNPVDLMVSVLAGEYGVHQANVREYAQRIATSLLRVANGADRHPITLASSSDLDRYNTAVNSLAALRYPLAAAQVAYRRAHNITN